MMPPNYPQLTHKDFEILKREVIYEGIFRFARYHLRFRLYNGGWSPERSYELLERKSAASVLPYDPVLDRVVLIEQFRPGAIHSNTSPWLTEIVAGMLDHQKEQPKDVARRETEEEAGCTVLDLYPICSYFVSPGGSNEHIHVYCGRTDASQAGGIHGLVEENENIRVFTLSFDEAFQRFEQGGIHTAPATISLLWLQNHRNFIRELWLK